MSLLSCENDSDLPMCPSRLLALLLQKPPAKFWRRHHALLPLPEPAVAVACNPAVYRVTERLRYGDEAVQQRPRVPQAAQHTQSGGGLHVSAVSFDKYERVEGNRGEVVPGKQPLPGVRLQRREADPPMRVAADGKHDGGIAQVADAVEQNNGPVHIRARGMAAHPDHLPFLFLWNTYLFL